MGPHGRVVTALVVLLAAGVVGFGLNPWDGLRSELLYDAVAACAMAVAFAAVTLHRPSRRAGWLFVLTGFSTWVLGDLVWCWEQYGLETDQFPTYSDAFYIGGYLLLGIGALLMVRTRRGGRDVTALLDALIVTAGATVVMATFVIAPLAQDATLSGAAKLVSSAYPLADLMLLAILARLATTPGARTASYALLMTSLGVTLGVDFGWNLWLVATGTETGAAGRVADTAWLSSYVLAAAAAAVPSMKALAEPPPDREDYVPSPRRLIPLAAGLVLPAVALLVDGWNGASGLMWPVIAWGMIVLSILVLLRMAGLLSKVQVQAVRLSAVARSDALTGAPNRRTWDHELARACAKATATDSPLAVAMIDLDYFKAYNDAHGHQAGDLLLREAVAAWTEGIGPKAMLARYGGEEFAALMPGVALDEATRRLTAMRALTPAGQAFSAGVSMWDPSIEPGVAVARADEALYHAKRTGRDRVVAYGTADDAASRAPDLPDFGIAVQPIVDIHTRREVAYEALARFTDGTEVGRVFKRAHRHGYGDLLEAATLRAAAEHIERRPGQMLHVNVSPAALSVPRFWDVLQRDLSGIVVEINDDGESAVAADLAEAVQRLRGRGAQVAVVAGGGRDALPRLAGLHPDVVKIDRSVVGGCTDHSGRRAVVRALVAYADELDVVVIAEGVENRNDLACVAELGVGRAQGYLLGRPTPVWRGGMEGLITSAASSPAAAVAD